MTALLILGDIPSEFDRCMWKSYNLHWLMDLTFKILKTTKWSVRKKQKENTEKSSSSKARI